jgi:hypothetical protein
MTSQQRILHSSDAINYATFVHQFLRTRLLELVCDVFLPGGIALPLFELAITLVGVAPVGWRNPKLNLMGEKCI